MIEVIIAVIGVAVVAKFLPSLILLMKFSYPNAKFSAIPTTFLQEREIARLLESKNLEQLKNNVISRDFILEGENAMEIQNSIDKSFSRIISMAKNDSPKKVRRMYDAFLNIFDAYALKDALRALIEGEEVEVKGVGEEIRKLVKEISGVDKEEAMKILREHGWELDLNKPYEEIERDVDRRVIEKLLAVPLPLSCKKARDKFVKVWIDILNIKSILRGKYYGLQNIMLFGEGWEISRWQIEELLRIDSIPEIISMLEGTSYMPFLRDAITDFEKYGVVALEKALDRYLIRFAGDIANEYPLSIGPGIRFIIEKGFEARNLKIVAKAVAEQMQNEAWKVVVVE